jgi:hypothetical protein
MHEMASDCSVIRSTVRSSDVRLIRWGWVGKELWLHQVLTVHGSQVTLSGHASRTVLDQLHRGWCPPVERRG